MEESTIPVGFFGVCLSFWDMPVHILGGKHGSARERVNKLGYENYN